MVVLRVRDDPHLVVVAILQHNHGDGTGVTFARRGCCARRLRVVRRQVREVVPPAMGGPAFPCLQALVPWDTEVVGSRWWGGPLPASGDGCGPGLRRWRYERVYLAQVWDPQAHLGRLVGVEPPDPRFNEVVRDLRPGGDERLELSHKDLGCRGMWQGDYGEKPVRVDVTEVFPEGGHQLARVRGSVDVVERLQFRVVEGIRAPLLWRSGGRGGHGDPVLVQCRVSRGGGGAVRWRPVVPQARTPWGVSVAGASSRAWRWAGGPRAPGGWRSLSSLCPPLVRSRHVPGAAMYPPWPGGFWTAGRAAPPPLA